MWVPAAGSGTTDTTVGGGAGGHLGTEFRADCTPLDRAAQEYGHEMEATYILLAAAKQLGCSGDELAELRRFAARVGQAAQDGYDGKGGGGFWTYDEGGPVLKATCSSGVWFKEWWPQFEGMSGLFWQWRLTGEAVYWQRMLATLCQVARDLADPRDGEFFQNWAPSKSAPVGGGTTKADKWKAGRPGDARCGMAAHSAHSTAVLRAYRELLGLPGEVSSIGAGHYVLRDGKLVEGSGETAGARVADGTIGMDEARQRHQQLLQRQFFGREPPRYNPSSF
ncbi:N-acyl-D-glucosamine 2-epimerase [Micractinium conductrix]|uniref:N-acylglucosamine 2-epimerase n=1 Tax=Micractinium conductrix TaxID=554055 RepID=A0A2P6VIA9_9CHLO|nr:N-acyl-D-glucosamine 2-epimerase [Micractinium conductrix]|eukprot:PSC73821.1 N-acyl-D-glucosamine 2-epimerase [Micractinium conductrix]